MFLISLIHSCNCLKYLLQSLWDIQFMMSVKRQTTSQSLYREIIHCWLRWSQWSLSHQYLIEWSLMLMAEQIFSVFHHCEGGEFLFHTKEKGILKEKRKAPTCGTVRRLGNTPFPTQRIGSIRHLASLNNFIVKTSQN